VIATESSPVTVIGQVYVPQILYSRQDLTVTRAIAMAGGVLPNAHVDKARIFRRTADGCFATIEIDLRLIKKKKIEDFRLQGGDILEMSAKYGASRRPLLCPDSSDQSKLIK
jgi:protein involved in polysaccharide export with SLBB domain